jgi:hypothetical protein
MPETSMLVTAPSGGGVQRVLTELRKLAAKRPASPVASKAVEDDPGLCGAL